MRPLAAWFTALMLVAHVAMAQEAAAPLALTASPAQVQAAAQARIEAAEDAEQALDDEDPRIVAAVIRSYAEALNFESMPALVRRVTHPRIQVREAAREAVRRFERNAIWQLRELYEELTGEQASRAWSWDKTASELYAVIDAPQHKQRQAALKEAHEALRAGNLDAMASAVERALAGHDEVLDPELAIGHATLGAQRLARGDLGASRAAFERAQRLCPSCEARTQWHAQALFAEAESSLAAGLVDLSLYERVVALDPTHAGALDALDRLTGAREQRLRLRRTAAAGAAALLFLWLALRLARVGRAAPAQPTTSET